MPLSNKEHEVINNINKIICMAFDIRDIYSNIVAELKRVMDFDRMSISLITEGKNMAVTYVSSTSHRTSALKEGHTYPLEGSLLNKVVTTGSPAIIEDTEKGELATDGLLLKDGIRSRLGFPLKVAGKTIGSINFGGKEPKTFSPHHLFLLEQIAPQLSMVTENTILFQKIKASEEKYKDLYDHAPAMYCTYRKDGTILECNETVAKVLGYPRDALVGRSLYELIAQEGRKEAVEVLQNGYLKELEFRLVRQGGDYVDVSANVAPQYDETGNITGSRMVLRDITEEKHSEEKLLQEKEKLEQVVEALRVGLCLMDKNLSIVWANDNLLKIWGLPQIPLGQQYSVVFQCAEADCPVTGALQGGQRPREIKVITKDGQRKYIENIATPIQNKNGDVVSVLLLSRDITARESRIHQLSLLRQLGNALQHTLQPEKVFQLVLTCVTAGHAMGFNRAFLFLVNEESTAICGMMAVGPSNAQEAGRIWQEVSTKYRSLEDLLEDVVKLGPLDTPLNIKTRLLAYPLYKDDEIVVKCAREKNPIAVRDSSSDPRVTKEFRETIGAKAFICVPLLVRGKAIGVILADNIYSGEPITDNHITLLSMFAGQAALAIENAQTCKTLESKVCELTETQERLLRSERFVAMGEMAAYIAHEIRNPLVTIGGFARSIENSNTPDVNISTSAQIIVEEVKRLEKILDNIKDFSKPAEPKKARMQINLLMEDTLSLIEGYLRERNIKLVKELQPNLPVAFIDPAQIKQVILNLIKNAIESMPKGGTLTIRTTLEDTYFKVDFSDTGEGIPPEVMHKIFTPFFTTKTSGTGVGLAVSQKIVDDHEGKLRVTSAVGRGSTFSVLLPVPELAQNP
ncbi:MAG TPA: GAF domain-containing protein [Candidatus Hypogeohydataceae bacterium YC38]